jgi:hypothetical protein
MAVMSFAHLKPSKVVTGIAPTSTPAPVVDEKKADSIAPPGVMSFAHLRPGGKQMGPVALAKEPVKIDAEKTLSPSPFLSPSRTTYRIPVILPTARLSSVNYCRGCGRFMPATPWEKTIGVPYGRCRRDDEVIDGDDEVIEGGDEVIEGGDVEGAESVEGAGNVVKRTVEVWKIIPAGATVARCWYWVKERNN